MTVNVSKPAINVREKLAELEKPSGVAGEAMLRAETPQEQFNLINAGRKNFIINGDMQVAQRGTSFTNPNATYTLDRFQARAGTSGALTVTQEDMPLGQTDIPGIKNFMRLDQTTARTGAYSFLWQKVEDIKNFDNATLTFSFYAKCDVEKEFEIVLYNLHGSGGSSDTVIDTVYFYPNDDWQRFEFEIEMPSLSGQTIGSGSSVLIEFRDESLGTWTLDITGVQLERGRVATPFEHRSYGEELDLCQRYFIRVPFTIADGTRVSGGTGRMNTTTNASVQYYFKKPMRAIPTFSHGGTSYLNIEVPGDNKAVSAISAGYISREDVVLSVTITTASTVGHGCRMSIRADSSTSANINFDAELQEF